MKLANFIGIGIFLLIFLFVGIGVVPFEKLIGIDSFTIMFIVFMVLFAIYLIGLIVFVVLNRRKRIIEVVEFSAPEGMTPADAGYVIDKTIDDRDISALLVYWAAKKYLEIDEKEDKNVLLKKLKEDKKTSMLFITHDIPLTAAFCDRIAVMHNGTIAEEWDTAEVLSNPSSDITKKLLDSVLTIPKKNF